MAETAGGGRRRRATAQARSLDTVVDRVAGEVSASREKQLRMVAGMWDRALDGRWPVGAVRPRAARDLFGEAALRRFWHLAAAGQLRERPEDVGRALPVATLRVVRDCLGVLAGEVVPGRAVWLPEVPRQEPKAVVAREQLPVLYRKLADMAAGAPEERNGSTLRERDRVRLLALVAVVLDSGARSAELEAMRMDDLGEGEGSVLVRRQPQNGVSLAVEEMCVLGEGSRQALRRWFRVRADLVTEGLTGGDPGALWVSLRPNQWQETVGLPLRAQGIRKAYGRGVVLLNGVMAGQYGWEPLPRRLEQLRRTVTGDAARRDRLVG